MPSNAICTPIQTIVSSRRQGRPSSIPAGAPVTRPGMSSESTLREGDVRTCDVNAKKSHGRKGAYNEHLHKAAKTRGLKKTK